MRHQVTKMTLCHIYLRRRNDVPLTSQSLRIKENKTAGISVQRTFSLSFNNISADTGSLILFIKTREWFVLTKKKKNGHYKIQNSH